MNNSFKYLLVTAILFNLTIAGCGIEQQMESPDGPRSTLIDDDADDDNGGDLDRDDRNEEGDDRDENSEKNTSSNVQAPPVTGTTKDVRVIYKDGSYLVFSEYKTPAGLEKLGVNITLTDGKVEAMNMDIKSDNEVSQKFRTLFAEGISELVIGKPIDEIGGFKVVNGSSLTSQGFNMALEKVKADATG
jgi:predicted small lipoprotein YifL